MFSQSASTIKMCALAVAMVLAASATSLAVQYKFLTVAGTGTGNTTNTTFTSQNNGTIGVTHFFPNVAGVGGADNANALIPSQFLASFPFTGQVDGHLLQTVYGYQSVTTFTLTNYNLKPSTVFGMWNTSDEVSAGPGQPYVYQLQLVTNAGQVSPTTFNTVAFQDNEIQVQAHREMLLNTSTGEITPGALWNGGAGVHTYAKFWDNIPLDTKQIILYADLPTLNNIGDGVGFYFAEVIPEPTSAACVALGLLTLGAFGRRRIS